LAEHTLDRSLIHHDWDNSYEPVLSIASGDVVHLDLLMAGHGQVHEHSAIEDVVWDFDTIYNLAGPIHVEGARPGDTLAVEVLSLEAGEWGWCVILPELGLLPDDYPDGFVRTFDLRGRSTATLVPGVEIPIAPFCGTMGTCPDREGTFVPFPPHEGAGNVDTRHLTQGTAFHIPVHLPGAHFSIGDPHAAQGDGEVCVAAIECPMRASLRFDVIDRPSPGPWFTTPPGSLTPRADAGGYYGTMGIADDLMEGARTAVRNMIALLGERHGLEPRDAYMLCSLAGDLKILEVVDAGMWNVGMLLPRSVFV
jgi:acetamidase/formamidase